MVSHGEGGRDSCPARGVTDLAIGSSGWLGFVPSANDALSEIGPWLCLSICSTLETHRGLFKIRLTVEHSELQRRDLQNDPIWPGTSSKQLQSLREHADTDVEHSVGVSS